MQRRASTYIQWLQHLFVRHSFRETPSSSRSSPVVSFESNRLLSGEDCGAGVDLQLGCSATATAGLETAPSRVHSTMPVACIKPFPTVGKAGIPLTHPQKGFAPYFAKHES